MLPCAVVVFNLTKPGNVLRAILGDQEVGTSIGCSSAGDSGSSAAAPAAATAGLTGGASP
jgi:hypothetical protein